MGVVSTGSGEPVTVVAHGLGASVAETRPLVGGVPGTRVLYAARGHGASPLPAGPVTYDAITYDAITYDVLADDLAAVADDHLATQALGVSMGAGSLLRLLARRPDRFTRVVLFLPAVLDHARSDPAVRRLSVLAAALTAGDRDAVLRCVLEELPPDLRPAAAAYAAARTEFLLDSPGVAVVLRDLTAEVPVVDRTQLASVTAEVLILAQEGDPLHPAQVGRDLANVLPSARLVVFDRPGVVFRERARFRELVSSHLGRAAAPAPSYRPAPARRG